MTEIPGQNPIPPEDFLKTLEEVDRRNLQEVVNSVQKKAQQENYEVHLLVTSSIVLNPDLRRLSGVGILIDVFSPHIAPIVDISRGRVMLFDKFEGFFREALGELDGEIEANPPNPVSDEDRAFSGVVQFKPREGAVIGFVPISRDAIEYWRTPERYLNQREGPASILMSHLPRQIRERA